MEEIKTYYETAQDVKKVKVKKGKGVSNPSIAISSTVNTGEYHKVYFDSYGLPPQKEIITKFKSPIIANDFVIQNLDSQLCGQYCLYVLYRLNQGEDFLKILLELKNFSL